MTLRQVLGWLLSLSKSIIFNHLCVQSTKLRKLLGILQASERICGNLFIYLPLHVTSRLQIVVWDVILRFEAWHRTFFHSLISIFRLHVWLLGSGLCCLCYHKNIQEWTLKLTPTSANTWKTAARKTTTKNNFGQRTFWGVFFRGREA